MNTRTWVGMLLVAGTLMAGAASNSWADEAATASREVVVEMTEYAFSPDTVDLVVGEQTRLVLVNRGRYLHEFEAPYFIDVQVKVEVDGVAVMTTGLAEVKVPPGGQVTLTFTPEAAGNHWFVCDVLEPRSHANAGMRGTLRVRE